jgi:hypothetical protein
MTEMNQKLVNPSQPSAPSSVKLVNLTPHEIVVYQGDNVVLRVPPSGQVARVTTKEEVVGVVNGVPLVRTVYGEIQGLPDPQPGTIYIVSLLVLQALQGRRSDVVAPNTSPTPLGAVRDAQGRIIGVRSFVTL